MTNPEQKAFLAAIEADPDSQSLREVYADWLLENDQPEEADRQRQWLAAFKHLATYTGAYQDSTDYDPETDRYIPGTEKYDHAKIMDEIGCWVEMITRGDRYTPKGDISFNTNFAQDELQDPAKRAEFWRCFTVVTGVRPPEELTNREFYHCAC